MLRTSLALLALLMPTAVLSGPAAAEAGARTWYVDASAPAGGTGTPTRPFTTLAAVESASRRGDTIRVLPSASVLDGGIRLKRGQSLIGGGPGVTALDGSDRAPTLTNTTERLAGDAVRLADDTTVRNLRIREPRRGAVYGRNVTGVRVIGNDVAGHNADCVPGFLIPQFNAPTNVPGVGIPIVGGLQNGWAGIMVDGSKRTDATAYIAGNEVHDAECGDGIDVRTWGTATYRVTIAGNELHHLQQGPDFMSLLAIGLQTRDTSRLHATVTDNRQADLGNPDDLNVALEGADSEGVFVNGVGPSSITAVVERNTYTNEDGIGGFSANGLEAVTMGDGTRLRVIVRDSQFSGSPGDVIEHGALGTNGRLSMLLKRVTAERSTGEGNTWVLPFNNGDCVLAGSLGAGNDVRLKVRDSVLRDCANNGLAIGSNVVNGRGPTKHLSLDVDRTTITGNEGANLGIRNFTGLESLDVRVQRSDLARSIGLGSSVADVAAEDFGWTGTATFDLGGGSLDSVGGNCVAAGALAMNIARYDVSARHLWWGRTGGPGLLSTVTIGGSLDATQPLTTAPSYCS